VGFARDSRPGSRSKESIRKSGYTVLVEGYMDVIGVYAAGIREVVASCGTALTTPQVRIMHRHADTVVVNFDPDAAGANVSALVVQVRNPETVAGLLGQATQPAVPVLNQMLDTLLAAAPDAAASRLVVNALLATGTTRGGGRLELGGAAARIGNVEVADLPVPVPPPLDSGEAPPAFTPPFAAAPAPAPTADSASGYGDSSSRYSGGNESSLPLAAPTAPSGAAHTPSPAAAPGGSTVAARPVGTTAPGGASAPLVLGAALLAIAILALGDKLRLRRLLGSG